MSCGNKAHRDAKGIEMKFCIRCNPVSQLQVDENGEDFCLFHGKDYWLEVRPDPGPEDEPEAEKPLTKESSDERDES